MDVWRSFIDYRVLLCGILDSWLSMAWAVVAEEVGCGIKQEVHESSLYLRPNRGPFSLDRTTFEKKREDERKE